MPQTVFTMLMFSGQAEEAVRYYVESIPQSELLEIRYFGPEQPGSEGKVQGARLRLAGHDVRAFDSPVQHDFGFTPAVSLFIDCHDEPEFERCFVAGESAVSRSKSPSVSHTEVRSAALGSAAK
jgi:predicted 3-demethylubiquinone-9 3-methyltransferase (glyoxalase superfamily)